MNLIRTAALVLAFAPLAAEAQTRVTPVLSTSLQRTCQGEVGQTTTFDATGRAPLNQPQVAADTRSFRATRAGDGYVFEQGAVLPHGETILRVNVAADGAISNAVLSGAGFERALAASAQPVDRAALAQSLALEIPERLIVGRSFAVGDQLYSEQLRQTLIGQMTAAMGVPFPVTGVINVLYAGEQTEGGRRVYLFEGGLQIRGEGEIQATAVSVGLDSQVRLLYDAETGLIVNYDTTQQLELNANGQPLTRNQSHDRYTCQIIPQ